MLKKPKNRQYTKAQKGRLNYQFNLTQNFLHAPYALISLDSARLTASHIAAAELAIKRVIRKDGTLFTRVFPHLPVTKKPLEVRMGKGKGAISYWMTRIRPGTFLFELNCSLPSLAKIAFAVAQSKLPFPTKVVIQKK